LEQAEREEATSQAAVAAAGHGLSACLLLPGLALAALGHEAEVDERSPVALAASVGPLAADGDDVGDGLILTRYDRLQQALAGGYDTAIDEDDELQVKVVHVADDTGRYPLPVVAERVRAEADAARNRLAAREREVLERFLLRELADELRSKLLDAHDLVQGANRALGEVRTSHGKGAHLDWHVRDDAPAGAEVVARLLVDGLRDDAADTELRAALLGLIEAERAADPVAGYGQHLSTALDYRSWHRFAIKVTDVANPGSRRTLSNRLGLSQGEQRVLSYLALFAAAAAHFDAVGKTCPQAPRLLLLDDAFAKVDEPTHGQLLALLVRLRLDFVLTSERLWGCFPTVPSLEIYEAVRDPAVPGVALVHFRWDGRQRHLVGV
ncbi:MAG: SbcC/MukB-like Walker B domain-containing protein, partial [Acidimicrobiales bacterium]